jgi:SPP1 gp7 family putative phage head morphogenesis protein
VKQSDWKPVRRVEQEYYSAIWGAVQRFFQEASKRGVPAELLNAAEFLEMYARQAAARMITGLLVRGARTWREAARESGKTQQMYAALQREMAGPVGDRVRELIRENAQLITTLPKSVALLVAQKAAAQQQAGGRPKELASALASRLARHSAMRLARTETAKASSALTQARAEELDLPAYVWETSQDERVRLSHRKMQGVVVFWDDPPSPEALTHEKNPPAPYQAGRIWNCRCYSAVVVRAERLQWPRKVYANGQIRMMTLSNFRRLAGLHQEMAA